jgi:hypothetical protein
MFCNSGRPSARELARGSVARQVSGPGVCVAHQLASCVPVSEVCDQVPVGSGRGHATDIRARDPRPREGPPSSTQPVQPAWPWYARGL